MKQTARPNLQPEGAYVSLENLQRLRHLAEPSSTASSIMARVNAASGRYRSRALSRGMEFEEVRLYQAGDDVRNIDWRVTARTQVTHTKCYRDEKEKPVITWVDQRQSSFFGSQHCFKSVYACHLAALINWATIKRGDRAGGLVLGTHEIHETRPGRSHRVVNRWLQQLQLSNHQLKIDLHHKEPTFSDGLKQLLRVAHSGAECILVSDCYDLDDACEKLLFQLSRHNKVHLYWLYDSLEETLPLLNRATFSDGTQKSTLSLSKQQQTLHNMQFLAKKERLQHICRQYSISLSEVNIQANLMSHFTLRQ